MELLAIRHDLPLWRDVPVEGLPGDAEFGAQLATFVSRLPISDTPLPQANAFQMVRRRAVAAEIETAIGNHSFRATGITAYLKNGGTMERAATIANHASTRTTQLYDRRPDDVTLDEVERILI